MSKLLFIGIDALDFEQIKKYADYLPVITSLKQNSYYCQMNSVWPPDSETAWASIYTGWNPARHGIFEFVDPLEKTSKYISRERDNAILQGHTFWDLASLNHQKVCVLFPHIGYPSWPVNGAMITRSSLTHKISAFPESINDIYDLSGLNEVKGLAGRDPGKYIDDYKKMVKRQLDLTKKMLKDENWDLFFTYWSALDGIQHQFWAHCDPDDPTYLGENPWRHVIRDFYALHDQIIGELMSLVEFLDPHLGN